jgi:choline dehydrogenase-like flavoprotein
MKDRYDAIIVGSGAGGGTVAYRLTKAGMKVLLLEQGPRFDRLEDYPLDREDWEKWEHFEKQNPDSYITSPQPLGEKSAGLMSTLHGRQLQQKPETGFKYVRASGIGGSTLRYQAEAHRFPDHAFRMKSLFGVGEDWPMNYKDLEPYYKEAEELLGVAGDHNNPFKPQRKPFPMPAHPLGCPSQRVKMGIAKLGLTLLQNSLAIPTRSYRGRPACIYCRGCGYGCMIGDKGSVDLVMIQPAEATGKLTVRTGARALKVDVNKKGMAEAVIWKRNTGINKSYGKVIVVSCGAIETPRLLLNSISPLFPNGLANTNGLVGTYLMTHLSTALMVYFDRPIKSYQGLPIDARIWDFSAPKKVKEQGAGFTLGVMGAPEGLVSPARFATVIAPGWGKSHKEYMKKHYGAHTSVFGVADHNPRRENTVTLASVKDENGMSKAKVTVRMQDTELKLIKLMIEKCAEIAAASGAKTVGTFTSLDMMGSAHVAGTARMGTAGEDSVVNSFGQSHDVRNLFIADSSTLVTQGCGDSPALTIMALALRTADYIASIMKRGSLC